MTIERPMFPPRLDNPFRLVGGVDVTEQKIAPGPQQEEPERPDMITALKMTCGGTSSGSRRRALDTTRPSHGRPPLRPVKSLVRTSRRRSRKTFCTIRT
jgi:hypothetical protein